jgi:hypothetical protein
MYLLLHQTQVEDLLNVSGKELRDASVRLPKLPHLDGEWPAERVAAACHFFHGVSLDEFLAGASHEGLARVRHQIAEEVEQYCSRLGIIL